MHKKNELYLQSLQIKQKEYGSVIYETIKKLLKTLLVNINSI